MPWEKRTKVLTALVGALLSTVASRAIAATVGSVTAVNPAASGIAPGAGARSLTLGADVVFNETIKTSGEGSAQLSFLDRSTLNVGRNSSLVIDKFVYDPDSGTGSMGVNLTTGVLRFVGGQISHTSGVSITTPVAVVAVRGGSATVGFAGSEAQKFCPGVLFINHIGSLTLSNKVDSITIGKQGYGVCVTSEDKPFPEPILIPDWVIQAFLDNAGSSGNQHGGATDLPSDQDATRFGLGSDRLDPPGTAPGSNPLDIVTIINSGNSVSGGQSQDMETSGSDPSGD
jgi:hypothetical protein